MSELQDFGEKIGFARKDIWKERGLSVVDLSMMNPVERTKLVSKDNIWKRPNWEEKIKEGTPQEVCYWQNFIRKSLPAKPPSAFAADQENYVHAVGKLRDMVMAVQTPEEIDRFFKTVFLPEFATDPNSYFVTFKPEYQTIASKKLLKAVRTSSYKAETKAVEECFGIPKDQVEYYKTKNQLQIYHYDGKRTRVQEDPDHLDQHPLKIELGVGNYYVYLNQDDPYYDVNAWKNDTYFVLQKGNVLAINFSTREDAMEFGETYAKAAQSLASNQPVKHTNKKERKKNFIPPQLENVTYTGPDYRQGRDIEGEDILKDLHFRGGEFGNWVNEKERQMSMNMAYEALNNLADLLRIEPSDLAFHDNLAIAFGARGYGGLSAGSAHYEPGLQVINLTKMKGAGCLAHEWAHALDHAIGFSIGEVFLASDLSQTEKLPKSFVDLLDAMKYKTTLVTSKEEDTRYDDRFNRAERNLDNWIFNVKPRNLLPEYEEQWNQLVQHLKEHARAVSGHEYFRYRRSDDIFTVPEIEALAKLRKETTGKTIPMKDKREIALWVKEYASAKIDLEKSFEPYEKKIETDYYKDSVGMDKIYTKMGHGYWHSSCEMFARAFDCYIADKIKEAGYQSDYLSANADSYRYEEKGVMHYAFPVGEERTVLNQKFDTLIQDLKELGILHDAPARDLPLLKDKATKEKSIEPAPERPIEEKPKIKHTLPHHEPIDYSSNTEAKQMSFFDLEELIENAETRKNIQLSTESKMIHHEREK